jgi:hypothetical protein
MYLSYTIASTCFNSSFTIPSLPPFSKLNDFMVFEVLLDKCPLVAPALGVWANFLGPGEDVLEDGDIGKDMEVSGENTGAGDIGDGENTSG